MTRPVFEPIEHPHLPQDIQLPDELWLAVLSCSCSFGPDVFDTVMSNLMTNPNITSSHLFRADIFYDSERDHLLVHGDEGISEYGLARHLKSEYRPIHSRWPGFSLERTVVRQLIPRNPQVDRPLIQTCHFYRRQTSGEDAQSKQQTVVLYIPHAQKCEDLPFYHPAVSRLAFLHTWDPNRTPPQPLDQEDDQLRATVTILYRPFSGDAITAKLSRTALRLLQTIHKHGQGQLAGYEKRVHLDQIIAQKRYQDTYTRLKSAHGRRLAEQWVEVTDPGKHVFEDLGIAAFLIELWRDMYQRPDAVTPRDDERKTTLPPFPGFVDIGCGNGVLVYILQAEGYPGWGFDARRRKTWDLFPDTRLEQRILVPSVLPSPASDPDHTPRRPQPETWHSGIFEPGTFIVSNHADELTAWTPLLAALNRASFIAIPCCSHDLAGARFRAPVAKQATMTSVRLPQQKAPQQRQDEQRGGNNVTDAEKSHPPSQAAETGTLAPSKKPSLPSAYASLCTYVGGLAREVGFEPEQEVLRIPSTRNQCIVGRRWKAVSGEGNDARTMADGKAAAAAVVAAQVQEIVERELKTCMASVAQDWIGRAEKLAKKPGSGH